MKKVSVLALVILFICSFVGCNNQSDSVSTYDEVTESAYEQETSSIRLFL